MIESLVEVNSPQGINCLLRLTIGQDCQQKKPAQAKCFNRQKSTMNNAFTSFQSTPSPAAIWNPQNRHSGIAMNEEHTHELQYVIPWRVLLRLPSMKITLTGRAIELQCPRYGEMTANRMNALNSYQEALYHFFQTSDKSDLPCLEIFKNICLSTINSKLLFETRIEIDLF